MLPQCDAFGVIYDQSGAPALDVLVTLKRVEDVDGNSLWIDPEKRNVFTDVDGTYRFTLPQNSIAYITARATMLWTCDPQGQPLKVPASPEGEFEPAFPFSPPISAVTVMPPLQLNGNVLSIPKASATQDGYLSAADYLAFLAGAEMGVVSFNARTGEVTLVSLDVTTALGFTPIGAIIPGVAGTWPSPASITVNNKGQIIAITPGGPDLTPPDITLVDTPTIGANDVTITWHTNEPADSRVDYGLTATYTDSASDAELVTDHTVTISGLLEKTTYHFQITSTDTAGNPQVTADATFITLDVTAPVITPLPNTLLTHNSITINWQTDEPADSQVAYGTALPYTLLTPITNPVPPGSTTHAVHITGLVPLQTYHYSVKSKDASGNLRSSLDASFTTAAAPDTTAPNITGIIATPAETSVVITWNTDDPSDSQVSYGPDNTYGTTTPPVDTGLVTTGHSVTISGLTSGVTYHYSVKSTNAALLPNTSPDATFTTTLAPVVNSLLTGLVSMWKLDESGPVDRADSKGTNNFVRQTAIGDTTGKINLAATFDGTGQRMTIASNTSVQTGPVDYTLAVWVKIASTSLACVWSKAGAGPGSDEYQIEYIPGASPPTTGRFSFTVQSAFDSSYASVLAATVVPVVGQWHLIVAWHNQAAGTISIQVDNAVTPDSFSPVPPLGGSISDVFMGDYGNGAAKYYNGAADEAAYWKGVALSTANRNVLWNGGFGLPFSSWTL